MKIALLLHGLTRRYDISYPFIKKNIIDNLNADVFISCWENQVKEENINKGDNFPLQGLIDLYKPKAFDFEIYTDEREKSFCGESFGNKFAKQQVHYKNSWNRFFAFYYKVWKANELKKEHEQKNNFEYDVVIKWRTDIFIKDAIDIKFIEEISKTENTVFIPFGHGGDVNDIIYMSNSKTMDRICRLYHNINEVSDRVAPINSYEKHLLTWINMNNLKIKNFNINWEYITFRPNFKIRTLNQNNILNVNA